MPRLFHQFYSLIQKHKAFFIVFGILVLIFLGYTSSKIRLEEDITKLIPSNEQSETMQEVLGTVDFSDKIIIHISTADSVRADSLVSYATVLLDSAQNNLGEYISKIQGKVGTNEMFGMYGFVNDHLPLFLDDKDYEKIEKRLDADSVANKVRAGYRTLLSPAGSMVKGQIVQDPLQITFFGLKKLERLRIGSGFELYQNFLVTKDHKNLLLFIDPALPANETEQNTEFIKELGKMVETLNQKYAGVDASIFGSTAYAVANAEQIKKDIQLTVGIALGILLLILIAFYRNVFIPVILFVPTVSGALLALTFLYFFEREISAVSLGIGSVLLGITLDYSLHTLTHIRNSVSVHQLFKDVTAPVLMSGFTTAVAFGCLLFIKSEAFMELGVFASISVLGAAVVALLIVPQLYKTKSKPQKPIKKNWIDAMASYSFHKNKALRVFIPFLFFIGLFFFNDVEFNNDISTLNYQPEKLVNAEEKLAKITDQGAKSIYMVSHGKDLNTALRANHNLFKKLEKAEENGEVAAFSSIGGVVLSTEIQREKIAQWNEFWTEKRKENLKVKLISQGVKTGFKENAFEPFFTGLEKDFQPIVFSDYQTVPNLFMNEYVSQNEKIATVVSVVKINPEKVAGFVREYENVENVISIDRKELNERLLGDLRHNFNSLIGYSTLAVFLILLFSYRNMELSLLTLLPIFMTWAIVLGIMDAFNIQFNIFNIMVCTFIFGLGVDYSIFMTKVLRKKFEHGIDDLSTFRSSILLSVITTLLGIGALIFAKHPALHSVALVSIIGILTAAVVTFVVQPFLFHFLFIDRSKKGLAPLRLRQSVHAVLSFLYFGTGAFLLSTFSALIIPIVPIGKGKKMLFFHRVLSKFMKSVLYTNPFVKKRILNLGRENFEKPCIVIANHSSFLDILTLGMLHPKLIFLVNDWVYTSPIFGKAVKLAGFYPVSSGIEGGVDHLREKVRQGYSLVAFPEGSRSRTQKIRRFHKGAFYLSEQLELDILPVLIHGNAHVLPKGDFVIQDGEITVEILKRIPWNSEKYGKTYSKKAKQIGAFFKSEFEQLQNEVETTTYFRAKLLANYRYKTCFKEVKRNIDDQIELFHKISDFVGTKDTILQFGGGKGMLGFYLCFKNPQLKIRSLVESEEKLEIARNCFSADRENIQFVNKVSLSKEKFNLFLISKKTDFPFEDHKNFIKLYVDQFIISRPDFDYQWLIILGFEISYRKNDLLVLRKAELNGQ